MGTASWTDKTLLASGWYPEDVKSAEERLRFYASAFPAVEAYYERLSRRPAFLKHGRNGIE